ncbi:hypothetical protein BDN70DRAFT_988191 [Pholiota conissans]|uniref:F-box domain-containing protein n=1 Tax=Pholiota conissans TaxID=109636 RepID=A0A9P5ZFM8_9AGAR|nr:hypothetical protein BDN70DRAFT_988191 [Pholiota conissans]
MVVKIMQSIHDIIPSELLSEITPHLIGNNQALRSLSLVSRQWAPAAQKYLFSSMTVRSESIKHNPNDRLAFLQNAPRFASYVTHLTVVEMHSCDGIDSREEWDKLLCQLLPLFGNIKRLSLQWAQGTWWPNSFVPILESNLQCFESFKALFRSPKITHVDFTRVPISWIQYLSPRVKFIGVLDPVIDRYVNEEASGVDDANNRELLSHIRPYILLIDGLEWASCSLVGEAVKWLMHSGLDVTNLRKLGLGLISAPHESHKSVMALLTACSGSLKELSLTPSFAAYVPAKDDFTDVIDLSVLRKLRLLHIGAQAGMVQNLVEVEPMQWLLPQLKRFPRTNRLQYLIFGCEYTVYETVSSQAYFGLNFSSYNVLDSEVLTSARFPKLKYFTNYIEDPQGIPAHKLRMWIFKSLLPYTLRMSSRNLFLHHFGGSYRKTVFPADVPWSTVY